ncbi:MAG: Ig-like domain-containing protein [Caloramator sp.]|nr:Ig-like domain-containing protein [Caloramator sp.]
MKKKSLIKLLSVIMSFMILVPYITANAAVIPKIKFNKAPLKEYKANERVVVQVSCPNYKGKVEYRAIVYDTTKKTYTDVWNASNGFPGRFNTKLRQVGNKTFTITFPYLQPGVYKVYVYVRRAGISLKKVAIKSASCDSYVASTVITIKPAEFVLNKKGTEYSPENKNLSANINGNVKIAAENIKLKNVKIAGDLYLSANNSQVLKADVNGTVTVDPGKDGNATLEDVTAKEIKILSGGENSIHLYNVKAEKLSIETQSKIRVVIDGDTKILNTQVGSSSILQANKGSFGAVEVNSSKKEKISLELSGKFEDKIVVKSGAEINAREGAEVSNIEVAVENNEDIVKIDGKIKNLQISRQARIHLGQNAVVEKIIAEAKLEIEAEKGAKVDKVEGSSAKDVKVTGEGAKDVGNQGNNNNNNQGNNTGNNGNTNNTGGGSTGGGGTPYYSVNDVKLDKIAAVVKAGDTISLSAEIYPSYATNKEVTWSSDNTIVATVSKGIVTALKEGEAVITVKTNDGNKIAKFKIKVTNTDLKITLKRNSDNRLKAEISSPKNNDVVTVTIKDNSGNLKYIDQLEFSNGKGEFITPLDSGEYTIKIKGLETDIISLSFNI